MQAPETTRDRAKRLRRNMNRSEVHLWGHLRANRLDGEHFRRQHPLGPYILDFFCARQRLAVEVDGGVHEDPDQQAHDAARDAWLGRQGVRVLHLSAYEALNETERALAKIRGALRPPAGMV